MGITGFHIRFPYTVAEWANKITLSGVPTVIGSIGCTHIVLRSPSENECAFINQKHFHSFTNVQIIWDVDVVLATAMAWWPGLTYDSFTWRNSSDWRRLEARAVRDSRLLSTDDFF